MIRRRTPIKRTRIKRKAKPKTVGAQKPNARKYRNVDPVPKVYMAWVKTLACAACFVDSWRAYLNRGDESILMWDAQHAGGLDGQYGATEAAHHGGGHAAKAANWRTFPLCTHHHRGGGDDSHEVLKKRWGTVWDIDVDRLIDKLNEVFKARLPEGHIA